MVLALPLAALLFAAAPDEGRGGIGTVPEQAVSMRTAPRWRAGLGGALLFGLANYAPSGGVGFSLDTGIVLADRLSLFAHGEVGSVVFTLAGGGALLGEYAFSDHFSAGLGVSFNIWAPLIYGSGSLFYGLTFPLRVSWAPNGRAGHETGRSGLLVSLQVAPGFSLQPTYFYQVGRPLPPEAGLAAMVCVGYALW
jgi:hypothetical protein